MTEHKQIWNWMEFRDHIAKRPEINDKYPISLVCKAVAARNEPFVWDAYTAYLNYCALQTTAFKSTGSLKIPLAAAVHYGCGLLGRWNTLLLENSQQEYFRYGKDGWNSLTEVSRKRFLSFYRSELPTRSHLASNPFLNRPFLVMLGLSDDRDGLCDTGACFEKMVPLEAKALLLPNDGKQKNRKAQQKNRKAQFLFIDYRVCKRLHKWLTTSDDVDDFLDGLEPKIESLWLLAGDKCQLKEFIAARITADEPSVNCAKKKAKIKLAQMSNEKKTPLLGNDQWTNLICCINKAAPNIIPKVGKKEAQLSRIATRAAALRTFMVANYFALHLGIFSDGAKSEESKGKYGELASCGAILSCIAPLYTRPSSNGESIGFEYCDFANYIAGYAVKSGNGGEQALKSVLKKLAEQVDTLQSVVACFARIEQLALAHRHTPVSLLTENIIRECCVIDDEVLHHVNKWRYWFEENLSHVLPSNRSKAGKGSKFVADLLDNDKMVGASRKVTDILDRMCRLVGNRHTCKDNSRTETDFRCVFLYSEPGCGKENIAKIVHLLGLPILAKRPFVNTIAWTRNRAQDLFELTNDSPEKWQKWLNSWGDLEKTEESIIIEGSTNGASMKVKLPNCPTNYFVLNCGEARDRTELDAFLFGKFCGGSKHPERRSGAVLAAHLTAGSVFLDEFSTLDPKLDAIFLRFFDKPYQYMVRHSDGGTFAPRAELLAIMGSNMNREELIAAGFNPAVVFRVTRNFFSIPPLRERKEDIAVFVLHELLEGKNSAKKSASGGAIAGIHRMSMEGMRLICEMDWEKNYRGVRAFLDVLLEHREIRGLQYPEVSFEEVVEALQELDALRSNPDSLR